MGKTCLSCRHFKMHDDSETVGKCHYISVLLVDFDDEYGHEIVEVPKLVYAYQLGCDAVYKKGYQD